MIDEKKLIEKIGRMRENVILYRRDISQICENLLCELNDFIEELPKAGEWISCSERLPDKADNYLITVSSFDETASIEYETVEHCNSDGTWLHYSEPSKKAKRGSRVVAWMPLPKPWEGEK